MNNKSVLIREPYSNYKIFHPDGNLMCFCSKKKAFWYLTRNLAEQISEFHIKLLFEPNGPGDPEEILEGRPNCCVISGSIDNLTKHHVIPQQYRKHFPLAYKNKNSSDLVILSRDIHDIYENYANEFKTLLFNEFVTIDVKKMCSEWVEARSIKNCFKKHYHKLPPEKQVYMQMRYESIMDKWKFNEKEILNKNVPVLKDYNKIIIDSVGIINLIIIWKYHFIKYAEPKYLPTWWKPNLIKIINDDKKTTLFEVPIKGKIKKLLEKYDLL